ncbi:MAG: thioesterase family protein [Dysgonomonas sp.]
MKKKTMSEIIFKHTLPIQIRFNDVDKFGHINNAVYFSFYDLGKTKYFESVCPNVNWNNDAIVVVHIDVDFMSQIFSTDDISVQTAITKIGTKSFELAQRVVDSETGDTKCICRSVMVAYDLVQHKSKPLNDEWVEAISAYEERDFRNGI